MLILWQNQRVHILEMDSFEQTFGAKAQRKRPKVPAVDMEVTVILFGMYRTWRYTLCVKKCSIFVFAHNFDICQPIVGLYYWKYITVLFL